MSKIQKTVLGVAAILFVLCGLFPPVKTSPNILSLKHAFLFRGSYGYIDVVNLLTRWLIIVVTTSTLIYLLKQKQK